MSRTCRLPGLAALACAGVVLTGCSVSKGKSAAPVTPSVAATSADEEPSSVESSDDFTLVPATKSPKPAASPSKPAASASSAVVSVSPSASPTAAIAAGRVFAFVKSVDVAKRTVTYDQAQFLTGDAAVKAAAADKQELDNDYYIRNVNPRLRTAPLTPAAALMGSIALTGKVELNPVTLEAIAAFAASAQGSSVGFWITIDGTGHISKVEEQYVP